MLRLAIAVLAVGLVACSSGAGRSDEPSESSPELPRPTLGGPKLPSPTIHIDRGPGKSMTLTGTLGTDSIEGGCAYIQTDKSTRYEVIYPKGWNINRQTAELSNPQGEVVATAGDTITVRGEVAADVASICQIGRILRADQVIEILRQ
jgi:hypothetical protein